MDTQNINITRSEFGLVWKVLTVIGVLIAAVGGPALTWYLNSSNESSQTQSQNVVQTVKIELLEKRVDRLERELSFLRRGGISPGLSPR